MREPFLGVVSAFLLRPTIRPLVVTGCVHHRLRQAVEPSEAALVTRIAARPPENVADVKDHAQIVRSKILEHEPVFDVFPDVVRSVAEHGEGECSGYVG
jgi:hypothetical protein